MNDILLSWKKEIPEFVKNLRDGFIALSLTMLPFQSVICNKLHCTADEYAFGTSLACGIVVFFAKLCGVKDTLEIKQKPSAPNDKELTP